MRILRVGLIESRGTLERRWRHPAKRSTFPAGAEQVPLTDQQKAAAHRSLRHAARRGSMMSRGTLLTEPPPDRIRPPIGEKRRQSAERTFLRWLSGKPQNALRALDCCAETCIVWAPGRVDGGGAAGRLGVGAKAGPLGGSSAHPAYLTEQRKKEHNFAKIKLEAFLRAYIGNAEECNRKVQGNLAKQKEVEKLIKKMTQDYVPDRINEVKMNSGTRGQQSQTKQNAKEIKRKIKASNGSSTSPAKSKKIVSTAAQNTQLKTVASSLDGTDNVGTHSCAPFKTKRQMSPSKAGENVSKKNCASRKPPATRPGQALGSKAHEDRLQRSVVLKTKEQKASKGNSARPSPTSAAKIYSNWHSTAGKKTRKQFGSEKISRSSILKRPSGPKPHQNGPREKLVKCRQKNRSPKDRRERGNSPSRTASKCHRVNWASDDDGGGDNATASYRKKCGLTGCTQEGRNGDGFSTVQPGTTFLHELCQEMAQEVPGDWTVSESNRSSSPKELGDARAGEDHVSSSQSQERVLEESCKQDAICIPLVAPAGCRCSELPNDCRCEIKEEQEMGFPGKTAALLKSLDKEQSEDEFTNSSLSSSGSSSSWFYEQMGENITLKEGINPKFLQKLLKAPKNGTVPQEVSHQYEKQK